MLKTGIGPLIRRMRAVAALLGVALLVVISVRSAYLRLRESVGASRAHTVDFVVAYNRRIQGVRPLLPASGKLGYVSDQDDTGQFFATQYLLAPWAVVNGDQSDWVLINNHPLKTSDAPGTSYSISDNPDGARTYDFGNGIKLIDKRPGR